MIIHANFDNTCENCYLWFDESGKLHVRACLNPTEEAYYFWYRTTGVGPGDEPVWIYYWSFVLQIQQITSCEAPCKEWVGSFYLNQHPINHNILDWWQITEGDSSTDPRPCWGKLSEIPEE